ncbi:MAG TPA: putative toxin-antitoxin system toxin component, PIN family [Nitrospirae bacterium]|nr:putative toxin-antitoxin system toxin component, PIN family [Nitrospirota bacterium]
MRVVFDTNIFISALAIPNGRADEAMLRVVEGKARLPVSKAIIHEVLDVLARKFDRDKEELARVAVYLTEIGIVVRPRRKIRVLSDDPDNRILECAVSGEADIIVTGDKAMLNLGEYKNVKIVSLKKFLEYV